MMESVRITEAAPGYEIYEIDHPLCTARVARHGAHVMEWRPKSQREGVLYCSPEAVYKEGKAIRGGVPICWPWFNAHPVDPSKPSHGFVRTRFWKFEGAEESQEGVRLRFSLEDDESTLALWPHPFRLTAEILLGGTLEVRLTSDNIGTVPFVIGGALHSYLRVGEVEQVVIEGLEQAPYLDTTGVRQEKSATGEPVRISNEVDRIYHQDGGTTSIVDPVLDRVIHIDKSGSPSTVVWNPWIEKARAIADMPDEDYRRFVAVEAVIEPACVITVEAGASHVLSTTIRV